MKRAKRHNKGKIQWTQTSFAALEPMIRILEHGEKEYGRSNWKKGFDRNKLLDCLLRHVHSLSDGEEIDPTTGINHIAAVLANAMFYSYHFVNKKK